MPIASSFWIMASCGSLALTLRACPAGAPAVWGVVAGPAAYLGLMNVPFLLLFHPIVTVGGQHALCAMWALRLLCAYPLLKRLSTPQPDAALLLQLLLYAGGTAAGGKGRRPCWRTAPHPPAWCPPGGGGLDPLLRAPGRGLGLSDAGGGLRSSRPAAPKSTPSHRLDGQA